MANPILFQAQSRNRKLLAGKTHPTQFPVLDSPEVSPKDTNRLCHPCGLTFPWLNRLLSPTVTVDLGRRLMGRAGLWGAGLLAVASLDTQDHGVCLGELDAPGLAELPPALRGASRGAVGCSGRWSLVLLLPHLRGAGWGSPSRSGLRVSGDGR